MVWKRIASLEQFYAFSYVLFFYCVLFERALFQEIDISGEKTTSG